MQIRIWLSKEQMGNEKYFIEDIKAIIIQHNIKKVAALWEVKELIGLNKKSFFSQGKYNLWNKDIHGEETLEVSVLQDFIKKIWISNLDEKKE